MNIFNKITKVLFILLFIFIASVSFCNDWIPKKDFFSKKSERDLLLKIINKQTITYCIDEEYSNIPDKSQSPSGSVVVSSGGVQIPYIDNNNYSFEIKYSLQKWFKNVLRRAKQYPNFIQEFADIIDILETPIDMKEIKCGPHPKEYSFSNFKTKNKNFIPGKEIEDLRVVFSSKETLLKFPQEKEFDPNTAGFYYPLSDRKLIWVSKQDAFIKRHILIHEFGHLLGLADVSYDEEHQAKDYGTDSQKTIMALGYKSLSCDDADGLVALIYMAMGKDKNFYSFCDKNILYSNGHAIDLRNIQQEKLFPLFEMKDIVFENFYK